ncbi:MAG: response regulator [Candidatus Aureabacteria bacterium]|nr:response regulator [Candidatus Auribacterota bacterium]
MNSNPLRILLVEDNPGDARLIQETLSEPQPISMEVTLVDNLQKAYQSLKEKPFDVVLLDLSLPDATGFEAFVWLYAQAPEIPIIILTGLNDQQLAIKAIRKGAQDYLIKGTVDSTRLMHSIMYAIERHNLKQALKNSEKKYYNLIESANDAIITADAETGIIIDANKKAEDLLGIPVGRIIGMHYTDMYPEDQKGFYQKVFLDQIGQGKSVFTNLFIQNSDRQRIPVEVSSSVSDIGGKMVVQGIYRDITERKKIEKLKDEFVSAVSHELRTPLTSIREGTSQFLDGLLGETTDEQKQFLNIILEDIDRLQQIIDELLDISKIESGRVELRREQADLVDLVCRVLPRFHGFLRKKLDITTIMPQKGLKLFFDAAKITQVITNLISNAYKFTDEKGKITIEVSETENEARICVSDTGVGISRENLPKIFEKFVQVDRANGPGIKGTGLGLPISKALVEMHGGQMWAESVVGEGTKIFFTLPKLSSEIIFNESLATMIEEAAGKETRLILLLGIIENPSDVKKSLGDDRFHMVISDMKSLAQEGVYRSDDTVIECPEGLAVMLLDTDRKGGLTVGKRIKKSFQDYLSEKKLDTVIKIKLGISIYPDNEKYTDSLIEDAKKNLLEVNLRNVRILLVDDEITLTELMKIKMESKGFKEVITASDGQKALDIMREKKPDLIILDMQMPVMNGYEVIGRLKTNPQTADIPIIILSGFPVDSRKLDEMGTKKIPVLSKPLDDSLLSENIEKVLMDNL